MIRDPGVMPSNIVQLDHAEEEDEEDDVGVSALSARTWDREIHTNRWVRARTRRTSFNATTHSEASSTNGTRAWAQFRIRGQNTRGCRVYFDSPIQGLGFFLFPLGVSSWSSSSFSPDNAQDELNGNWIVVNTTEVRLWSPPWDRKFVVDVIGGMSRTRVVKT
ncbi:hypothetical protein K435DRAFT_871251 [Dendrothele bispora CBS 962.96]|uniref:Uncharacterized protein n=1 Tax=Dendrothele bispora (strain CBS 962.96) TaxID=1314807 RepID=A0A4S8L4Z5_DENBC|nr:hypothetical protein K435DRAFT_871251 [Dendrothele bispora CBS 962.96]